MLDSIPHQNSKFKIKYVILASMSSGLKLVPGNSGKVKVVNMILTHHLLSTDWSMKIWLLTLYAKYTSGVEGDLFP